MSTRTYFPNLDGLRTIACLAVFCCHSFFAVTREGVLESWVYRYGLNVFKNGNLGVNFFFVLSGFLITYLLLEEERQNGRYAIGAFYRRRIFRIWPLYYACVFFGFVVMRWAKTHSGQPWHEPADPMLFVTFLANFDAIFNNTEASAVNLNVLWSVAIEEQFYLVWPLLLLIFRRNRLAVFLLLIAASMAFRYVHAHEFLILYQHTFSVMSDLVMGGATAWLCFNYEGFRNWVQNWSRKSVAIGYGIGLVLIVIPQEWTITPFVVVQRVLLAFFFVFVILEQSYTTRSLWKISNNRFLSYWGTYTYGFYCLHFICIQAVLLVVRHYWTGPVNVSFVLLYSGLSLPVSGAVAWLSYRLFEQPFLRLKGRSSTAPAASTPATAPVTLALPQDASEPALGVAAQPSATPLQYK
ncbi:acyltransferase family protein [Hymenobacter sp. BT491]|uniref:acyltransferase family protein n=1 Tax=Hymenobacter sp. BT491 TaxID=2766779 RepID=UPI001653581A|nr:acyltransferase [Hymenobacter sp. BT491]MBC6991303.1 acyltransferase [Hymenobacter sp. BT491]